MPKRNYNFEKRQRELSKQRQREEKQQRKQDRARDVPGQAQKESGPADRPARE